MDRPQSALSLSPLPLQVQESMAVLSEQGWQYSLEASVMEVDMESNYLRDLLGKGTGTNKVGSGTELNTRVQAASIKCLRSCLA